MILTKNYEINSCNDVELGLKRKSKLEFFLTYDDSKDIKALLCVIQGCGGDADANYKEHLALRVAEALPVAVLSVDYFGTHNRSWNGARFVLSDIDKVIFDEGCKYLGLGDRFKDVRELNEPFDYVTKEIGDISLKQIDYFISKLKEQNLLSQTYHMPLAVTIIPAFGEYQNFGIMPAMDVINAILHIKANPPFKNGGGGYLPCVLVGSSHGGYIANLCAKIAPWMIDAVVDNASWNITDDMIKNKKYEFDAIKTIGFGKEIDFTKYCRFNIPSHNFWACVDELTHWTSDEKSPNYFSPSRAQIRDVSRNIDTQAKYKKAVFVGYHSLHDATAPISLKIYFYDKLNALGFKTKLNIISDPSQIDGKFIKNINHGMGMSIKMLILKELPPLLEMDFKDFDGKKEISYNTDEWIYNFKESDNKLVLACKKI